MVSSMARIEMVIFGTYSTLLSLIDLTIRYFKHQNDAYVGKGDRKLLLSVDSTCSKFNV